MTLLRRPFERGPDEEGIETSGLPIVPGLRPRSNADLMKKGLRLTRPLTFCGQWCSNADLMKKGLRR